MTDDIRFGETSSRLADLLAPAAVKAWAPLSRATVTVPQLLVDRAVAEAQAQAVWPDTPWLAAWALVAQHWTGAALTVADYNDVQADAPHRCAVYPLDLTGAPAACLQRSDQLRRHQPQASELQDPTAIDVHWHGRAEAPEAPEAPDAPDAPDAAVHARGVTAGLSRYGLSIWATAPSARSLRRISRCNWSWRPCSSRSAALATRCSAALVVGLAATQKASRHCVNWCSNKPLSRHQACSAHPDKAWLSFKATSRRTGVQLRACPMS